MISYILGILHSCHT